MLVGWNRRNFQSGVCRFDANDVIAFSKLHASQVLKSEWARATKRAKWTNFILQRCILIQTKLGQQTDVTNKRVSQDEVILPVINLIGVLLSSFLFVLKKKIPVIFIRST